MLMVFSKDGAPKSDSALRATSAWGVKDLDELVLAVSGDTGKPEARNCGTGKGGFKAGNNCAAGGDGPVAEPWHVSKKEHTGEFPADLEKLSDEEQAKVFAKMRNARREWDNSAMAAISEGRLSPEDAAERGMDKSDAEKMKPMPEDTPLYHVTVAADKVDAEGLRTRRQRGSTSGEGLGGGPDDVISLTSSKRVAEGIRDGLLEVKDVLNGKISTEDLLKEADAGGWGGEVRDQLASYYGKDSPFLNGIKIDSGFPRTKEDMGDGWAPYGQEFTPGSNHYTHWQKPMTSAERKEVSFNVYKYNSLYREKHTGKYDPYFAFGDLEALASMKPENIKVYEVKPVPGARAEVVAGPEAEYRIYSGKAVTLKAAG